MYLIFIGQDTKTTGKVAGKLMGQILNGHGKVAVVMGLDNLQCLVEKKSFETVIHHRYPSIEIVETVQIEEEKITAFKNTLDLLERIDDLKSVYNLR